MTPRLRIAALVCATLMVAGIIVDRLAERHEEIRFAALLDGHRTAGSSEEQAAVLAEVLDGSGRRTGVDRLAWLENLAASAARREQERQIAEARKWLKGWLEHETFEDLE